MKRTILVLTGVLLVSALGVEMSRAQQTLVTKGNEARQIWHLTHGDGDGWMWAQSRPARRSPYVTDQPNRRIGPTEGPEPIVRHHVVGGAIDASTLSLGQDCSGSVGEKPDFIVHWDGSDFLRFFVHAPHDVTLLINAPDGTWHCNDDSAGTNPQIDFASAPEGQYDVFIGSDAPRPRGATFYLTRQRGTTVAASAQ